MSARRFTSNWTHLAGVNAAGIQLACELASKNITSPGLDIHNSASLFSFSHIYMAFIKTKEWRNDIGQQGRVDLCAPNSEMTYTHQTQP